MSSMIGNHIKIAIFGQSHAPAIGVTIDGLPAGFRIDSDELAAFLARRAPGQAFSTKRREPDQPEFLCGVVDGVTCGAPLTAIIRNTNTRSRDYANLITHPRPGHADYTAQVKYGGAQDVAGGGHFSGRLTAPLCIAGGICLQLLAHFGVRIAAHLVQVGTAVDRRFDPMGESEETLDALRNAPFPTISPEAAAQMQAQIEEARRSLDSVGGIIECIAQGVPAGWGAPMFDGLENRIARVVFGIPAVKGLEFGSGFAGSAVTGSRNNDPYYMDGETVRTRSNAHGGILGGISSGMPVVFRAAFKPTSSIARVQQTVDLTTGQNAELSVHGRHDPCVAVRAVPCVEAAAAIALADAAMDSRADRMNQLDGIE